LRLLALICGNDFFQRFCSENKYEEKTPINTGMSVMQGTIDLSIRAKRADMRERQARFSCAQWRAGVTPVRCQTH
jgi:hypothetical protein